MSIPTDLSMYGHTHDMLLADHSHSLGVEFIKIELPKVYIVEFLFGEDETAEVVRLGVFDTEEEANFKAFNYSKENIDNEDMIALYIYESTLNEEFEEKLITEYYFD